MSKAISLKTSKKMSLKKWLKIQAAYPNIGTGLRGQPDETVYDECGFCKKFLKEPFGGCLSCPLYPKHCSNNYDTNTTYWKIVKAIKEQSPELPSLIAKMIAAINAVEV